MKLVVSNYHIAQNKQEDIRKPGLSTVESLFDETLHHISSYLHAFDY